MEPEPEPHALDRLDRLAPAATRPERLRVRLRVGVGGAIVLALVALVVTVLVSAFGQQTSRSVPPAGAADTASASASAGASTTPPATDAPSPGSTSGTVTVFVHVLGAVASPGVVELPDGSRVLDAIAAAGGLTATADPAGANLARRVTDGEQIYLPQQGELPPGPPAAAATGPAGSAEAGAPAVAIVNLNSATPADLETLPRIGPAMAQRIVDYRTTNGPFRSVDDLRNVTGIGDKTFEALRDLVRV